MYHLPADWGALCTLAFLLGLRHGLDTDNLAAIDGLTRIGARGQQRHSRLSGGLLWMGHGIVVLSIALIAGSLGAHWVPPGWFEMLGDAISLGFLLLIGAVNLCAVLRAPVDAPVAVQGVRGRLCGAPARPRLTVLRPRGPQCRGPLRPVVRYREPVGLVCGDSRPVRGRRPSVDAGSDVRARHPGRRRGKRLADLAADHPDRTPGHRSLAHDDAGRRLRELAGRGLRRWSLGVGLVDRLLKGRELVIGGSVILLIALNYFVACRAVSPRAVDTTPSLPDPAASDCAAIA